MRSKAKWVAVALVLWAVSAPFAHGLRLSQIEFDLSLPQGSSETGTFLVINDEAEATTVNISIADWDRALDGENRFIEPGSVERSASAWISVAPSQFTLQPDESIEVRFTLDVPEGIQGTYWTSLIVEGTPRAVETQEGTTILVRKRFAVKVLQTPPGSGERAGQIRDLRVTGQNPLTTVIDFENTGLVNISDAKGRVEIRDASGQTVESIPIEEFPVLPGATRRLAVQSVRPLGEVFAPGRYVVLAILDFGGENLLGGQVVLEIKELDLVPIGDSALPPKDLNEDGFYEDVNGDGVFDDDDPVFLGFHLSDPGILDNLRAFDFDNDGDVDFDDIVTLRDILDEQEASQS